MVLASVTEGEDKPLKYPTAFGLAHLVVVTKDDIAAAVGFDEEAFRANVGQVNPGVEVVRTSARRGRGVGLLLERALAVAAGAEAHRPVMAAPAAPCGRSCARAHAHAHFSVTLPYGAPGDVRRHPGAGTHADVPVRSHP